MNIKDIVNKMRQEGYRLSERTVKYWLALGLLPVPVKKAGGYRAGVKLEFSDDVVDRIKNIFELKGKGYRLLEIKRELVDEQKLLLDELALVEARAAEIRRKLRLGK